jgi:hypothetical protein
MIQTNAIKKINNHKHHSRKPIDDEEWKIIETWQLEPVMLKLIKNEY